MHIHVCTGGVCVITLFYNLFLLLFAVGGDNCEHVRIGSVPLHNRRVLLEPEQEVSEHFHFLNKQ